MLRRGVAVLNGMRLGFPGASNMTSCRQFSSPQNVFEQAQANVKKLTEEPDVETKLKMYALFKQASNGDVTGSRPGMMDFAGRAKFDAWSQVKGLSKDQAMSEYAALVSSLMGAEPVSAPSQSTIEGLAPVDGLDVSIEGKVFKITLNRPKKFNALTLDMYQGIISALEASAKNPTTSVTVITGTGNFFCSGNDLSNFAKAASANKQQVKAMSEEAGAVLEKYVQAYIDHKKPLLGFINGPAIGIAVTVLPLFDYVMATDKSHFSTPFATLGQSPEGASSYTFPLMMGQLKAAQVLLFGRKLTAGDALDLGLVSEVVPDAEFTAASQKVASQFSSLPPESLTINKTLLRNVHRDALTKVNQHECVTIMERWQSKECAQAIASFLTRK